MNDCLSLVSVMTTESTFAQHILYRLIFSKSIFVILRINFLFSNHLFTYSLFALRFSLEEDFMKWREGFWPRVCEVFDVQASGEDVNMRNYRLELVDPDKINPEQVFTGEMARLGSYNKQRPFVNYIQSQFV